MIPGAEPAIIGWMSRVFRAMRSDEFPVRILNMVPLEALKDTAAVLKVIGICTQQFESFRSCECQPNASCPLHTQSNQRPS